MGLPQLTNTKTGAFEKAVNLMMVFLLDYRLPSYFRRLPGNIKDVKVFRLCMEDSGAANAVAILDKAFPSKANLEFLETAKIKYIASLRRSASGFDYSAFHNRNNRVADGHFRHQGRTIWHKEQQLVGRRVIIYFDEERRIEEDRNYLDRVDSSRYENYTMGGYHAKTEVFGTIALITNIGKAARQLYEVYKTRCEVEQAIDVFKTNLDADSTCMQSAQSLKAYTFINFIAMQMFYIIREYCEKLSKYTRHK